MLKHTATELLRQKINIRKGEHAEIRARTSCSDNDEIRELKKAVNKVSNITEEFHKHLP